MNETMKALPEVEVTLGGAKKKIVCSFATLYRLEQLTGKNVLLGFPDPSVTLLVQIVACALYEKPAEHIDEVAAELGFMHLAQVRALIDGLFQIAMPDEDPEKKATANPNLPDGSISGQPPFTTSA